MTLRPPHLLACPPRRGGPPRPQRDRRGVVREIPDNAALRATSPDAFDRLVAAEIDVFTRIARAANIRAGQV